MKKKIKLYIVTLLIGITSLLTSVAVAVLIVQSIHRGYPLKITSSFVMFTLNGNTYLDDIKSEDLTITKGDSVDVTVTVGIQSNASAYVEYELYFEVEDNNSLSQAAYDAAINAIEVYRFDGYKFVYVSKLSELGQKEDGKPVYGFTSELSTDLSEDSIYRFVYSQESSYDYDMVAKDGKFVIKAFASEISFLTSSNQKYVYVNDSTTFESIIKDSNSVGKTIILNSNVKLEKNLASAGELSIDLNGYTLDTNGHNLTITSDSSDYTSQVIKGMRIDESNNSQYGQITGSGKIVLPTSLSLVDKDLANKVSYDNLDSDILTQFNDFISDRIKLLDGAKQFNYGEEVNFVFEGLEYLIKDADGQTVNNNGLISLVYDDSYTDAGFVKISYNNTKGFYIDDDDVATNDITTRYNLSLNFTYNSQNSNTYGFITIQGQSAYAIAKSIGDNIPTYIDHSYILKTYDSATAATIEWLVYDNYNGHLFNESGIYRKDGIYELKAQIDANGDNYYQPQPVDIYVKVSKGTDTYTYYVEDVYARPFIPFELTEFIYDRVAITVGKDVPYAFASKISKDEDWFNLVGLKYIEVTLLDDADEVISVNDDDEDGYPTITVTDNVDVNFVGKANIRVKFVYEGDQEYSFVANVNILGEAKYITSYDVSSTLQIEFNANPYTEGQAYEFDARTVLMPSVSENGTLKRTAVFVDYEVLTPEAKQFVSITYDYKEVTGNLDDFYGYFVYDAVDDCYKLATKDENGNYVGTTFYQRVASIEILPSRIPYNDITTIVINATLYTLNTQNETDRYYSVGTIDDKAVIGRPYTTIENGETVYAYYDKSTGNLTYLAYPLSLQVDGVITNDENGVKDYNLYSYLVELFDGANGKKDGIITSKEANSSWEDVIANLTAQGKLNLLKTKDGVQYLDLENVNISTLDGIEFFPHIKGISLKATYTNDLTPLSNLIYLEYLDISATNAGVNTVTNLLPLKYLDSLKYLYLNNTNITTLNDIRYLKSLKELDISNTSVIDFEPLTDMESLTKLILTKEGLTNNFNDMYNLALVAIKNTGFTVRNSNSNVTISNDAKAAASVMRDLENFNRVNNILYLPLTYKYNGVVYTLNWFASDTSLISINNDSGLDYATYTIVHPLFDTDLEISVQLKKPGQPSYVVASRKFNVTLESDSNNITKYIYSETGYVDIETAIPDITLRNIIFSTFNTDDNTAITIDGNDVDGKYVITEQELQSYRSKGVELNWSNKSIVSLEGIEYLAPLFDQDNLYMKLDLSYNDVISLEPLTALKLSVLVLGGKEYDLSELALTDNNDNPLLTSLYALDVHECVNISTEQSLYDLYQIYSNNPNVYIYKDKAPEAIFYNDVSSAWNPYDELVTKELRKKDSIFSFSVVNEEVNVFGTGNSFTFNLYGKDIEFKSREGKVYQSVDTSRFSYAASNGILKYTKFYGWEESAVLKVVLTASDGHKGWSVSIGGTDNEATYTLENVSITHDWYVQAIALDAGKKINVYYNNKWQPISDLFASYDIMYSIYTWFYTGSIGNNTKLRVSSLAELLTDANKASKIYKDATTGNYYITAEFLAAKYTTGLISISGKRISGEEITYGLELLPSIKTLTFDRDLYIGTGEHITNIVNIKANSSSVNLSIINIDLPNLVKIEIVGFSAFSATKEAAAHLTGLTTLDLSFSSGTNQCEIITDWSFLQGFIYEENGQKVSKLANFSFKNSAATNLTPLQQLNTKNWGYVYELYKAVSNKGTPNFKMKGKSTSNNSLVSYTISLSGSNDKLLMCNTTEVYNASSDASNDVDINTYDTYSDIEEYNAIVAYIYDMGLKVNGTYWSDLDVDAKYNLALNTELTLPSDSFNDWYGLEYDDEGNKRTYDISWKLYFSTGDNNFTSSTISNSYTFTTSGYAVIVGTINSSNSYVYNFIVGDGDGLYSNVEDRNLRMYLFARCSTIDGVAAPTFTTIEDTNGISHEDIINILKNRGMSSDRLDKDTTNSYIVSLEGFSDVVIAANKASSITTINLSNHQFLNISEFNCLTSLTTLKLDNTNVKLTGYTAPSSLTTFSIKNNECFDLQDLNILVTNATNLNDINIYNTSVQARYEVLEKLISLNSSTLTLAWNVETASTITKTQLQEFKDVIDGDTFQGYANGFVLSDFANDKILSGVFVSLPANTYNLLINFDIADTVNTVLTASSTTYDQLFVYYPATYIKDGANTGYIGSGTSTLASSFDTELLAYLFANGNLVKQGNTNLVKSGGNSVNINTNIGIKTLPTSTIDGITVNVSKNTLAASKTQPAQSNIGNPVSYSFNTNQIPLFADLLIDNTEKTMRKDITYSSDEYTISVKTPKYIYIHGVKYEVEVRYNTDGVGTFTYIDNVMKFVFDDKLLNNYTYDCSFAIRLKPEVGNVLSSSQSFTVTRLVETDDEIDQNNFLVEVKYDPVNMKVYMVDDDNNVTVSASVTKEPSKVYIKNGNYYYVPVTGYTSSTYYVNASVFFKSGRLETYLYWIGEFNGKNNNNYHPFANNTSGTLYEIVKRDDSATSKQYGKILLNSKALQLENLRITMTQGFGVTSLEGIQMFANTKALCVLHNGVTDFTPIRNFHLESFEYINSKSKSDFIITDFTPLIYGSSNTLKEFAYNGYGNVYATDLSFLVDCPNLEVIYFGTRINDSRITDYVETERDEGYTYLATSAAQYVLSSLYNRGVYIKIGIITTLTDSFLTLDKANPTNRTIYFAPNEISTNTSSLTTLSLNYTETMYVVVPKSYDLQAANVLDNLDDAISPDHTTIYSDFQYGYSYNILDYSVVSNTTTIKGYLPATLNYNGTISLIEWRKITNNILDIEYVKLERDGTETVLSIEEIEEYIQSTEYYNAQKSGSAQVYAKLTIDVGDTTDPSICDYSKLSCNVMIGDMVCQRMISLSFNND